MKQIITLEHCQGGGTDTLWRNIDGSYEIEVEYMDEDCVGFTARKYGGNGEQTDIMSFGLGFLHTQELIDALQYSLKQMKENNSAMEE